MPQKKPYCFTFRVKNPVASNHNESNYRGIEFVSGNQTTSIMKKDQKHDGSQKKGSSEKTKSQNENNKLEAKKAAKSIDTANRDAGKDDRKSGM